MHSCSIPFDLWPLTFIQSPHSICQYVLPPFLSTVGEHLPYLVVLFDHCTGDWRYSNWPYMVCQPLLPLAVI